MKLSSVLTASLLGLAIYLTLELFFGSYGLVAQQLMEGYVSDAERRLEELQERHDAFASQIVALTTDRETVRLEARDIGLVGPNEYVLRIDGREPRPRHRYAPGGPPPVVPNTRDYRPLFRSISLAMALVFILVDTLATQPRVLVLHRRRDDARWDIEVDGEKLQT
jgi:cell division protein FtsB